MLSAIVAVLLSGNLAQTNSISVPIPAASAQATNSTNSYVFGNVTVKPSTIYPWKTKIHATVFSVDKASKATDTVSGPVSIRGDDEIGFVRNHEKLLYNSFRVALPFNDLQFPDKARHWVPMEWQRSGYKAKSGSLCQDRWIEIKNAQGRVCYAQWEDVGPLPNDHPAYVFGEEQNDNAEYVFGDQPPGPGKHPGLELSPAVARYLDLKGKVNVVSWRFVDDQDIPPGAWLKILESSGFRYVSPKGPK